LLQVVEGVTSGYLPIQTAKSLIASAFPGMSNSDIEGIVRPLAK
jgi:hypothetical protein